MQVMLIHFTNVVSLLLSMTPPSTTMHLADWTTNSCLCQLSKLLWQCECQQDIPCMFALTVGTVGMQPAALTFHAVCLGKERSLAQEKAPNAQGSVAGLPMHSM